MDTRSQSSIAGGVILGVIGAVLYYAVEVEVQGIEIQTVGVIFLVAGAILAGIGLISGVIGGGPRTIDRTERTTRTADGDVVRSERVDAGHATYHWPLGTVLTVLLVVVLLAILL